MWNWSLPQFLTMYLLQQMRAASSASDESCSSSSDTRSKIRILGSGTPRLKRDLGYGLFLQ